MTSGAARTRFVNCSDMTTDTQTWEPARTSQRDAAGEVLVYTVDQVAGILQINPASVILATRNGDLPYRAFGKGPKSWRYTVSDMNAYVEGQARTGVGARSASNGLPTVMASPRVRKA